MYLLVYKQSVSWNTLRDHISTQRSSSKSESGASLLKGHANGVGDKHFKGIGMLMENTASGLESGGKIQLRLGRKKMGWWPRLKRKKKKKMKELKLKLNKNKSKKTKQTKIISLQIYR